MRLMHTKLPDFIDKMQAAGKKRRHETTVEVRGLENLKSAKLASLRVGRLEDEIVELTEDPNVDKVEIIVVPRNPETLNTVIVKGVRKDGSCKKAILECMLITSPSEDCELFDVEEIDDRRFPLS